MDAAVNRKRVMMVGTRLKVESIIFVDLNLDLCEEYQCIEAGGRMNE